MVQVGPSMDQEHEDNTSQDKPWTNLINDAVKDFVQSISESSRQLASAAERFAGSSFGLIDEATSKADSAAKLSGEMAAAAQQAASEAQRAAESLQAAVQEAGEHLRNEARNTIDEAVSQARDAQKASERARDEAQQKATELIERIERSNQGSQELLRAAQQATEEVRSAAEHVAGTAGAVDSAISAAQEAAEQARLAAERAEGQAAAANATVASAQQAIQEARGFSGRIESRLSGIEALVETAQKAAHQAESSAQRAESSAANVDATAIEVRAIAEQTREVVARIDETVANAASAADNAQQASQSAAMAAERAEQVNAGAGKGFSDEADTLLERLENDYQLLTSLVQELASRISSISSAASEMESQAAAMWEPHEDEPPVEAYEVPAAPERETAWEPAYTAEVSPEPAIDVREQEPLESVAAIKPAWIDATISYPSPATQLPQPTAVPVASAEATAPEWRAIQSEAREETLATWTPEPSRAYGFIAKEPVNESAAEETMQAAPASTALFGRVQVNISPVPDFDRLLSLDSALSRVGSVQTVTLSDYAEEEVTFRIDLASPLDANDFAQQLGEAAGISTEVAEAQPGAVTLRVA